MKTIIQGKNVKVTNYVDTKMKSVEIDGEETVMYTDKPEIKQREEIKWVNLPDIPEIDGRIQFNTTEPWGTCCNRINLNEYEDVTVLQSICRVDIPATVIHVDKELSRTFTNSKEDCREELEKHLLNYKQQVVFSNEKVSAYVRLHNLNLNNIDLDDLLETVYSNKGACIKDGKVYVKQLNVISPTVSLGHIPWTISTEDIARTLRLNMQRNGSFL